MKETTATPEKIRKTEVLRVTRSGERARVDRRTSALVCEGDTREKCGFIITSGPPAKRWGAPPGLYGILPSFLAELQEGDIVKAEPDGKLTILWETAARHNALYVTDICNSRCIMCPQRPEEHPRSHYDAAKSVLTLLECESPPAFGITGGEPLLNPEGLVGILDTCRERFPEAAVQLLTNGRRLADFQVATKVAQSSPPRLLFCIPLFADNDLEHDAITGVRGSFAETIAGIHNLVRYQRPVEIRVVLVRQNTHRLPDLAHFLFWNFPFAVHIAFMAMETSGVASINLDHVWIEPWEYREGLEKAVRFLHQRMMNVSIYNIPLCLLLPGARPFARDSISAWKKVYLSPCEECVKRAECGGFFGTSVRKPSHVEPFRQ